ncbi:MAG TPA: hypothetical protein VE010_14290 [Thermoanaerobaculia bacterium]|nr:hypothetical protein [Thermoanaerobaculia bacterium]
MATALIRVTRAGAVAASTYLSMDANERTAGATPPLRFAWAAVVVALTVYVAVAATFWSLIDLLTVFLAPLLWVAVTVLLLAALVICVYCAIRYRAAGIRAHAPLLTLLIVGATLHSIDYTSLWLRANFAFKRKVRETVITRVRAGTLQPNVEQSATLIQLPPDLARASAGPGAVVVERTGGDLTVLFFTFSGILGNFSGYVYSESDRSPRNGDFGGEFFTIEKVAPHWYWVATG